MDPITGTVVYKLAVLLVGFGAVWCGYQLFRAGIFAASGDMDARFKSGRLVLKQAAPRYSSSLSSEQ